MLRLFLFFCLLVGLPIAAKENLQWFSKNTKNKTQLTQPIGGLSDEQLDIFFTGRSFYTVPWVIAPSATTARDGLGPLFNANTCFSCHNHNGPGEIFNNKGSLSRAVVTKLNEGNDNYGKPISSQHYGDQVAVNGSVNVKFEALPSRTTNQQAVRYPDGRGVILQKPKYHLNALNYGQLATNTTIVQRRAPALIGLGLLMRVSEKNILQHADENDSNNDGISGRPNWIQSANGQKKLGRFTAKASASSLFEQVAGAAANDMGLTNPLFPDELCTQVQTDCKMAPKGRTAFDGETLDLPAQRLAAITQFISLTRVPVKPLDNTAKEGQQLFIDSDCGACHLPQMTTNDGVNFAPYTDLLLHDMGEGLADGRREYSATGREFRTAPLWGLTVGEKTLPSKTPYYLHDGRAKTIEEAILWHGGEAENSKQRFMKRSKQQRDKIITFLRSL